MGGSLTLGKRAPVSRERAVELGGPCRLQVRAAREGGAEDRQVRFVAGPQFALELGPPVRPAVLRGDLNFVQAQLNDARADRHVPLETHLAEGGQSGERVAAHRIEEAVPGVAGRPDAGIVAGAGVALELEPAMDSAGTPPREGLQGEPAPTGRRADPGREPRSAKRPAGGVQVSVLDFDAPRGLERDDAGQPGRRVEDQLPDRRGVEDGQLELDLLGAEPVARDCDAAVSPRRRSAAPPSVDPRGPASGGRSWGR